MKNFFSKTMNQLGLLLTTFILGLALLFFTNFFFNDLINKLDEKTASLKQNIETSKDIIFNLNELNSNFYNFSIISPNEEANYFIQKNIATNIENIKKKSLLINLSFEVNIETFLENGKLISTYLKEKNSFEDKDDFKHYILTDKKIKALLKLSPIFIKKIYSKTNEFLNKNISELNELEVEIKKQKEHYKKTELLILLFIIIFVLVFGYFVAKRINKNEKGLQTQQASTRAILDGQPNIVVVSNGKYMIDANSALLNFFSNFKSFNDFYQKKICICEFFVDLNNPEYIVNKDYNGLMWFEQILRNPSKQYKVAMKKKGELRHFSITARKKYLDRINEQNYIIIIVLNDISKEIEVQRKLKILNDNLENIVSEKTRELQELNNNLEIRIMEELLKNRKKDKQLIQQSRFAALGEMIGNIAHQWRQPLSAISSTASSKILEIELHLADNESMKKSLQDITNYVQFLSQTIDDFRTFFKEDKEKTKFNILTPLKNSLTILNIIFKENSINLVEDYKENELFSIGFENELTQVFLNIFNNAKDVLNERKIKQKFIQVTIYSHENTNIIEIIDNAGGIEKSIIDKIFDPYFTTKHQSQGTGIGLFMSKEIVEKHMKGSLTVQNKNFIIDKENYRGASFKIELPKI